MKKLFYQAILLLSVVVVLTFIYSGITHYQSKTLKNEKTPDTSNLKTEAETNTNAITPQKPAASSEKREVDVCFTDGKKNFDFKNVPMYQINYKDNNKVEIIADGNMAKALVEKLPEAASEVVPVPAALSKSKNSKFSQLIRGKTGYSVDKEKTLKELEKSIKAQGQADVLNVKIVMQETEGENGFYKTAMNMGFKTLIASFSTLHPQHTEDEGRNTNLQLAARSIDGVIVPVGAKFSFNKVVGPRTAKCGFKKAGVISQGKVIMGLGGGICQVSTTLYQAVLMSGMKINERHNHSIYDGIDYAKRGLDAAVAWGYKDFCFTNNLSFPVLIACKAGKGSVDLSIYAEKKPFENVVLETRNERKIPFKTEKKRNARLKKGQTKVIHPGVDGYTIEAFRIVTNNGKTKEERLSKDKYLTYNRIEESNN